MDDFNLLVSCPRPDRILRVEVIGDRAGLSILAPAEIFSATRRSPGVTMEPR